MRPVVVLVFEVTFLDLPEEVVQLLLVDFKIHVDVLKLE